MGHQVIVPITAARSISGRGSRSSTPSSTASGASGSSSRSWVSSSRPAYPERPIVGVGGVILVCRGQCGSTVCRPTLPAPSGVVLVQRRFEPLAGRLEPAGRRARGRRDARGGRGARDARRRRGWSWTVGGVIEVFDRIMLDDGRRPPGASSLRAARLSVPAHRRAAARGHRTSVRRARCGTPSMRLAVRARIAAGRRGRAAGAGDGGVTGPASAAVPRVQGRCCPCSAHRCARAPLMARRRRVRNRPRCGR